jgi:hypothetical protein
MGIIDIFEIVERFSGFYIEGSGYKGAFGCVAIFLSINLGICNE